MTLQLFKYFFTMILLVVGKDIEDMGWGRIRHHDVHRIKRNNKM